MEEIYLDNSATTRVCEKSAEKVLELMTQCYGNPSSLHKKGLEAQREVAHARQAVAVSLSAQLGKLSLPPAAPRRITWRCWAARPRAAGGESES